MRTFNPTSKHPMRAQQAWMILVGAAMSRQTLTYKGLSHLMYNKDAAGVLNEILGHVAFYCKANDLPGITTIVVGKGRGTPGEEIPVDLTTMDREREKVYAFDWYNVVPPTPAELAAAFATGGG